MVHGVNEKGASERERGADGNNFTAAVCSIEQSPGIFGK
jgi:hypothetical protein